MKNFKTQEEFISQAKDLDQTRSSLSGQKIDITDDRGEINYKIEVGKLVGAGASCLAYEVIVDDFYPPKKNMILKEFFPNYKQEEITGTRDNNNPINLHLII